MIQDVIKRIVDLRILPTPEEFVVVLGEIESDSATKAQVAALFTALYVTARKTEV